MSKAALYAAYTGERARRAEAPNPPSVILDHLFGLRVATKKHRGRAFRRAL
jgi:hypothetical protein